MFRFSWHRATSLHKTPTLNRFHFSPLSRPLSTTTSLPKSKPASTHPYIKSSIRSAAFSTRSNSFTRQTGSNFKTIQQLLNKSTTRLFSTTPQPPLLLPATPPPGSNINYDKYPKLRNLHPPREKMEKWSNTGWKWTKFGLAVYFAVSLAYLFGSRIFSPVVRNYVELVGIDDIERNGSASIWTLPLLFQDRAFTANFDPKYPMLNHYYFRIFLLKELEAAARAAEGLFQNSETLIYNSALRANLLKRVVKRGWASQYELTMLYTGTNEKGPEFSSRALTDEETIALQANASRIREEYEAVAKDQLTFEDKVKMQLDPRVHPRDRIDLSKQQLLYIQQGIDEFDRLADVAFKLQDLAVSLRTQTAGTMWTLRSPTQDWSFPFDRMTNEYHQLASSAAAVARLNDSLYILSTQNMDQILSFMRHFDKNIQLLNNPEQIQKNKFSLPVFPKLTFDVITLNEYTAQLASLRSQFRTMHDPSYDPSNPNIIRNEVGQVLNPDADPSARNPSTYLRDMIPYSSPARPYVLPHHPDFDLIRVQFPLEPTYEEEVAYSQNFYTKLRADSFTEAFSALAATWRRHREASAVQQKNEKILKKHIYELGMSTSE